MNRIASLFGIKYPIVQAGMIWCSGWELASAVSQAGGLGLIGSGSMYPDVLRSQGKAKNPAPNVDAISGTLLHHYGVHDCGGGCGFYTVTFGVSRILGVSANLVWARALGQPLERPKSLTTAELEAIVEKVRAA